MKVLAAIVTDATVAYWVKDGGSAEPVATVVNHGMTVDQVTDLGITLVDTLSGNGAKPLKREPLQRKAAVRKQQKQRRPSYNLSADDVLADIRANPGTICAETAQRLLGSSETGYSQAVNRRARELADAGKVTFSERSTPDRKGRPARSYFPLEQAGQ